MFMIERPVAKAVHPGPRGARQLGQHHARDGRHVELCRIAERRPHKLDEFGVGADDSRCAMGDQRGVGDEKSRIKTPGAAGGVIARAMKSRPSSAGNTPAAANRAHTPAGGFGGAP